MSSSSTNNKFSLNDASWMNNSSGGSIPSWMPSMSSIDSSAGTGAISTLESDSSSGGSSSAQPSFWDNLFEEGGEDDEESDEFIRTADTTDGVLFLIDGTDQMFAPNPSGEIPFQLALRCAASTLSDKIISAERDLVGVCVFGCTNKKNSNDFEGVYVLQDLEVPDAHRIIELEEVAKSGEYENNIGGPSPNCNLSDALWIASSMFNSVSKKFLTKRVFLFTNNDNPDGDRRDLQEKTQQRAQDLFDYGIQIELFVIEEDEGKFDVSKFYQEIISYGDEYEEGGHFHSAGDFEALHKQLNQKIFKKRALGRVPLVLGGGLELGVRIFNLRQEAKPGKFEWMEATDNQIVRSTTKNVCSETNTLLMPTQMKHTCQYGDVQVEFDKEELTAIKTEPGQVGVRILGFKPRHKFKSWQNLKHSSFLYPDEGTILGSTTAFLALLTKMTEMEQVAIAKFTPRSNAPPRLVALLAQPEKVDEDTGDVLLPSGLHVIYLPYADDIRNLKHSIVEEPSEDQISKAKRMVRALTIKFDSREFPNPHIQRHYDMLHALALEREALDEPRDLIVPDMEGMETKREKVIAFRDATLGDSYAFAPPPKKRKREEAEGEEAEGQPKKKAAKKDNINNENIDWWNMSESQLNRLTIPILKCFLVEMGHPFSKSLKKKELVEEVANFIRMQKEGASQFEE